MKLWQRYSSFLLLLFISILTYVFYSNRKSSSHANKQLGQKLASSYYKLEEIRFLQNEKRLKSDEIPFEQCSMSRCFNYSKCLWREPKVYVYPTQTDVIISPVYEKILRVIRESTYYTENPAEACLFVLSLDTTDRDKISENYIKDLSARIDLLPPDIWNEGRNHLIFNLYYGSYPDYSQTDIGFVTKNAIIAWASADASTFRQGFDISFPLFHEEHPLRIGPQKLKVKNPNADQYLSSFKGKRYVYGIGSNTRDSLYHLHNRNSTIVLTTCRHNTDWKKFEDSRCAADNKEYDNYDYANLLEHSAFCLTPRGRRLGSFRFLEALRAGCIPVILSDGWELPFTEVVDWSQAAIQFHENTVFFTTDVLNSISAQRIARMKLQTQWIYHRYFSSVEKIVLSTIRIVFDRINQPKATRSQLLQPTVPGNQPKFVAVLQTSKKSNNRPAKIIDMLAEIEQVTSIIVLWPKARGQPPEQSAFPIKQQVKFLLVDDLDQKNALDVDLTEIDGQFLLFVDERIRFTRQEVDRLMKTVEEWPNRLVTYHGLWHKEQIVQHANETASKLPNFTLAITSSYQKQISVGLLHFAAVHRDYLSNYQKGHTVSKALKNVASSIQQCSALLFNVYMIERTWLPPLILTAANSSQPTFIQQSLRHYALCLNKIVRAGYEDLKAPLMTTNLRV
ncbi:hypothetical protein M3Y97_00466500 [Aphelenchoides bicaudatus]|nr:hypothetical protein M3Y97_00466500 [Aphelenchoides bicaudatus]